jgi:hypothetical protein
MLTVLTQTPAFVLGNGNEDYGHPGCPFDMRSEGLLRRVSLQTGASSHELMGDSSRNSAVVAGTFARAYDANRKAAVEGVIEADPVAVCVRRLMAEGANWVGTASYLLRALVVDYVSSKGVAKESGRLGVRTRSEDAEDPVARHLQAGNVPPIIRACCRTEG